MQVPEPVSPRYRNRAGECRAGTGATVSSMNRTRTSRSRNRDRAQIAHDRARAAANASRTADSQAIYQDKYGGADGIRTRDLLVAK